MAEASDLNCRVTEIAKCPICLEDCKNARMLPCVHSFCLECLQGHFKDKSPGLEVVCPVCRKEFQIPDDGVTELQHNFFLQNLIDARDACQKTEEALCEVCVVENDGDGGEIPTATMYCADCNQKLCKRCSRSCRVKTGPHHIRPLGAELNAEIIQQRQSYCDQHKDEKLKLYCQDCEINVCLMCFAVDHNGHHFAEVGKIADEFKKLFDSDISSISARIDDFYTAVAQVDAENAKFMSAVDENGTFIEQKGETVNQVIQKQVNELLQELQTVKSDGVKDASNRSEELKLALTSLESFKIYLSELKTKGSPCDITRAAKVMRCRATELLQSCVIPADYRAPCVSFTPMNIDELTTDGVQGQNLIGHINRQTDSSGITVLYFEFDIRYNYIAVMTAAFNCFRLLCSRL